MYQFRKLCALLTFFLCCAMPTVGFPQAITDGNKATIDLQLLRWMSGDWQATNAKQIIDEHWSLQGNSLLGISRTLEGNVSKAFELLLIETQGEDLIVRLRFFGPAIEKATRGKDEPLRLKVILADAQQLICEGVGNEIGTTLSYTKLSGDRMQAQIRKVRDGNIVWQEDYVFLHINQQ
ncbi:DUF6265 family protein [Undibacterium sp. Ji22W]|uniref:DUF6265 family protein n=1 Tax=Undibacterium sp. Ji22W TaxID=3413038 RepID=UPI003BF2FCE4